jgi:hypothetical protein
MPKTNLFLARVAILLLAWPAAARTLPEFDALAAAPPARRALARPAEDVARAGTVVHMEERLGVPTFLRPAQAGENGRRALGRKGVEAESAARAHLLDLAPLWGLAEEDVLLAPVVQIHDTGKGPIVVQLRQEAFGVPVFRDEIRIAMDRSYEPVAIAGYLPSVAGLPEPVFALTASDALARAGADLGILGLVPSDVESMGPAPGGYERLVFAGGRRGLLATPARAKKVLFHLPGRLEPAWYLEVDSADGRSSDLTAYVFSAADGALLYRHRLVASDGFSYRVWADASGLKMPLDGPQGRGGDPYPGTTPDRWQAPFVPPSLVTLASGPISTKDPWLAAGATETNGNNVDAYADIFDPDGFSAGDFRANVTAAGTFDRTYDVTKTPDASDDQRKAAITQLFYVTNFLHDWYYDVGFNEVAGNAQVSNYGRGGVEGDGMRAEAQDYSGMDNADMMTPADGGRPRMQMYVWTGNARRGLAVTAPPAAVGNLNIGLADFGPAAFSVSAPVVLTVDGGGTTSDACEPLTNGSAVSGKIALVDRGTCAFVVKVGYAQAAGAIGVIVANNQGDALLTMADSPGATPFPYTIPAVSISQSDGDVLKALLAQGLAVTIVREAAVNRDGTIDNQIAAHEWAHYLSNRLVGNANGLNSNQSRGLGEGWSDFSSLLLTAQAGDAALPGNAGFGGLYPMSGYVYGGGGNGFQDNTGWYFGIRRYPYSTDMTKDPLTYKHIMNGVAFPATVPIVQPDDGSQNSEVHNTGEVWTTMLWECYAALLKDTGRLTFDQARDRMRAYFVVSLKLTPVNPTLLEARDALLAAAWSTDPDDYVLFVRAFAKRGAGPRAVAGDRFDADNAGTVESFAVGGDLGVVSVSLDDAVAPCDRDGLLDADETGRLTLNVKNRGLFRLSATQITVSSSNPAVSFPSGVTVSLPVTDPTQLASATVPVRLAPGTAGIQSLGFSFTLRDPSLLSDATATFTARGNADDVAASSASDDVESTFTVWRSTADAQLDPSASFERVEVTPFDHRWTTRRLSDVADLTLTSPPLLVSSATPFGFTFRHRYSLFFFVSGTTFYFDGGVIEISTDDGATWTDIGDFASPGYSHRLYDGSDALSPLRGQRAWSGDSGDLPGFTPVTVSLGSAYAGKTARVRFRRGMEFTESSHFWEIDDIAFTGITNTPFPALVADRGRCRGRTVPVGSTPGGTIVKKR